MGKKASGKSHIRCRRCGNHSYHVKRNICSHCGYGKTSHVRSYFWMKPSKR